MQRIPTILSAAGLLILLSLPFSGSTQPTRPMSWTAQDALGRRIGTEQYPETREGKTVGMFFVIWHGTSGYDRYMPQLPDEGVLTPQPSDTLSPYDNQRLMEENPSAPQYGPTLVFHHWGEPYLGYYLADDRWVIRKHAQMLSDAGVDVIILDLTNAVIYLPQIMTLCEEYARVREQGGRTPQISFIFNTKAGETLQRLYDNFYGKGLYEELWFRWKGKPLVLCPPQELTPQMAEFFTTRHSWFCSLPEWEWFGDGRDKWPWADYYPQRAGWHESPDRPEAVAVAPATHPITDGGRVRRVGRSYHDGAQPDKEHQHSEQGLCFAEQFSRAMELDPEFIFFAGWNEWMAIRLTNDGQFLKCGDRDIEPLRGGFGDNYYYQLADFIRRYKGAEPVAVHRMRHKISLADFGTWDRVEASYADDRGDVFPSETSLAFQFGVGDEYKITDIAYSEEIEQAAENKLAEEANKYYDQNSQPKVQYGLTVTKEWLKSLVDATDDKVVNVFVPGDYLHVVDDDIDVDKSVRIKSFTRNILSPYDYQLTISDITTNTPIINRVISDLIDIDKIITINNLKDPTRARANWRSSREVLDMVFDPEGDYYTDKIKPNSIDTLALSVGAKSMQFGLTNTVFQPNYNGNKNVIKWQGGVLTHYTINEETAVSWVLADGQLTLDKDSDAYYIYAKCAKGSQAGTIVFTKEQHKVDGDANYYYFWIGVLNSVDFELKARSLALTYGFTMVNGRFIKTGRIESADGTTYFDLDNSEIGGRIVFTSNGQEKTLEELGQEALESKDFINNTLPGVLSEIQSQLDGKIETWFQTTDPASSWTTTALKKKHVGDMWFRTDKNTLWRYSGSYTWQQIQDQKAIDAYNAASTAQDTADGKRRVFVTTPKPPYDIGDLWVDGKDLRRCITKRTTGSYVANDWVIAVNYDNTKTIIDGGIVTSGTIQVAGDNKSILAGITGQGTAATSIRFWAGASFENRATAPYRVMQDGSVVMTKATVEGIINAISGYIGGFKIQQGQIGYGSSSEQDTTTGLALLRDFIRFNNGQQRVLLGCLSSLDYPSNGLMELTGTMGTTLELHHKYASTSDESLEHWYRPKALAVFGNQYNLGKIAMFEKGYIGRAYTDVIQTHIGITHKYLFTSTGTSTFLGINLPTKSQIDSITGNVPVQFDLEIVCDRTMPNKIRIYSKSGAYVYDNNGNVITSNESSKNGIDMAKGDVLRLRYYNGGWNRIFYHY